MTQKEKVSYFRIALALSKISVNDAAADLMIRIYEGILEKKGEWSIMDSSKLEVEIAKKYAKNKSKK